MLLMLMAGCNGHKAIDDANGARGWIWCIEAALAGLDGFLDCLDCLDELRLFGFD